MPPTPRKKAAIAVAVAAVMAGGAGLAGACRRDRGAERRAIADGIRSEGAAPAAGWELLYEEEVDGNSDIFVIPAAGGPPRRITEDRGYDTLGRWTPDGKTIVFTSNRSGTPQLWEVSAEGGRERRLRKNQASEYQADPSPDGRRLAFLTNVDGPERLVVMDLATGALTELVRHGADPICGNPHWSPDGARIAFSSNWQVGHQIYVVDVATRAVRRISSITSGGCEPRFTRDGRRVAYVRRGYLAPTSRLVAHDLETGEEQVLIDWPALNYDPAFSPDGSEIAFASNITGEYAIYRQRLSDGRAWRVTFGRGPARYPDYRPTP
jgi:Tol biopolymer transport system component